MKASTPSWAVAFTLIVAVSTVGCSPNRTMRSVPSDLVDQAVISGMPHVRTWGDQVDESFVESLADAVRTYHMYMQSHPELEMPATADILAISGGGSDGAYGAGLLCGWSERGDRPEFRLVTGISTGALIAPLAFLGPEYDHVLKQAYTTTREPDVVIARSILALLTNDGMYDTDPLYGLIESWVNDGMVEAIAAEHAKGRRLLVGTVNLEAQRPVIWDLGAIASTNHPDAPRLLRQIMLASASIPGAFEPQYITVEVGGERYEEMHVDGGAFAQVFLFGGGVDLNTIAQHAGMDTPRRPVRVFVIRNAHLNPMHKKMKPLFSSIAGRAISTLIKSQGLGDLYRLYLLCQREQMAFHVTSIPPDFNVPSESMFDPKYMSALFQLGHERVQAGYPWRHTPPHLADTLKEQLP